jgi:ABC-type glycerol-3-phosphate transport system permease component
MRANRLRKALLLLLATLLTALNVAPLVWIALSGFKTRLEIFSLPPVWIPSSLYLQNFTAVLEKNLPFLANSIIITGASTVAVLLIGLPAAFALSLFKFRRKRDLEMWILSTRMMPPIAAAVPLFLAARATGLIDTHIGLIIVYTGFNLPFAVWLATSFFRQMPMEVIEAARVDGCTWWQVMTRVALPLNVSGTATVSIFTAIFAWNELLLPLFLTNHKAKTFTVVLTEFQGQTNTVWEQMAAGAAIQILPIVILTFLVQRYIVSGVSLGAVK